MLVVTEEKDVKLAEVDKRLTLISNMMANHKDAKDGLQKLYDSLLAEKEKILNH